MYISSAEITKIIKNFSPELSVSLIEPDQVLLKYGKLPPAIFLLYGIDDGVAVLEQKGVLSSLLCSKAFEKVVSLFNIKIPETVSFEKKMVRVNLDKLMTFKNFNLQITNISIDNDGLRIDI